MKIKRTLSNFVLKDLLNAVILDKVIEIKDNHIFVGGVLVPEEQLINLVAEAKYYQNSPLWGMLLETLKSDSYKRMFLVSNNTDDLFFGKAMLYNLDVLDKLIKRLANEITFKK